jgi:hypothetical protein
MNKLKSYMLFLSLIFGFVITGCDGRNCLKDKIGGSTPFQDNSGLVLNYIIFKNGKDQDDSILLWKSLPGMEETHGPNSCLKTIGGHELIYEKLGRVNLLRSNFTIEVIPESEMAYSDDILDYRKESLLSKMQLVVGKMVK